MTAANARHQAHDHGTPLEILLSKASGLNAKQMAWIRSIYPKIDAYARDLMWRGVGDESRRAYFTKAQKAERLLVFVDKAWNNVFHDSDGCLMSCDGETPHACGEALYRLRAIILFHT